MRKARTEKLLQELIEIYYLGAPVDVPLYEYLDENDILPTILYDPQYNNINRNNIISRGNLNRYSLHEAPNQKIMDMIRRNILDWRERRHRDSRVGGKKHISKGTYKVVSKRSGKRGNKGLKKTIRRHN